MSAVCSRSSSAARPACGKCSKLVAIAHEGHSIEPVILCLAGPLDPHGDLHGPTPQATANQVFQLGLERPVGLAHLGRELEMTVIHGAHFHLDGPFLIHQPGVAKTGHTQEQGKVLSQGLLGVGGKLASRGMAGTFSDESGDSAGRGAAAPEVLPEAGSAALPAVLPLPRDEPASFDADAGVSAPQAEACRRLVMITKSMSKRIQTAAVITVMRVNVSPALVPKALEPPTPPKAPASPPPLPRWIKTRQMRNSEIRMLSVLRIAVKTPKRVALLRDPDIGTTLPWPESQPGPVPRTVLLPGPEVRQGLPRAVTS